MIIPCIPFIIRRTEWIRGGHIGFGTLCSSALKLHSKLFHDRFACFFISYRTPFSLALSTSIDLLLSSKTRALDSTYRVNAGGAMLFSKLCFSAVLLRLQDAWYIVRDG